MAEVKTQRGGDILDGFVGKKSAEKLRLQTRQDYEEEQEIKRTHAAPPKHRDPGPAGGEIGGELRDAVETVAARAEKLFASGLKFEAIVLLVQPLCPQGVKSHRVPSEEQVEAVLTGLSKLREWLK